MKRIYIITSILGLFAFSALNAQVDEQSDVTTDTGDEVSTETTEKTYTIIMNDKVIKNSVQISTTSSQEVKLKEDDKNLVNQERVIPGMQITKTVKIDNDEDDDYDELITFRYDAQKTATDFVLISNEDEIYIGLDDGENLQILENRSYKIDENSIGKEAYIFTDNNGTEVEFFIDEYRSLNEDPKE